MNPRKMTALALAGSILLSSLPFSAFAAQDTAVVSAINTFKATNPNLPSVTNQKGNLGYILANIFDSQGKILSDYLNVGSNLWTSSSGNIYLADSTNKVGIGTSSPANLLSVGSGSTFQVDSNGNLVRVNNVPYSWPSTQATANQLLMNN